MNPRNFARCAAVALAGYGVYFGAKLCRYGRPKKAAAGAADRLLDRFLPDYEVVERHSVKVSAPAEFSYLAACEQDLQQSRIIRAIFKARELMLGAGPGKETPRGLLRQVQALGWGVLAQVPGREIVMGAVTRPWEPEPVFRAVAPEEFARFHEPGYVKIAWTLRADPLDAVHSVFRTETRAVATDASARAKFRIYWSFLSPGIAWIRRLSLAPLKKAAEARYKEVIA